MPGLSSRRDSPRGDDRGFAASSVAAIASVAIVTAALAGLLTNGDSDAGATVTKPTVSSDRTASGPVGAPNAQRAKGQRSPAGKDKAARERPAKRPTREQPAPVPDAFVEVYNNGGISGLAGGTAARLQDAGWQVVATDDWYGDIPASTVYYPPSLRPAAERLAKVLGINRVWPAVSPMRFDRLTVILTADYSG